MDFLKMDIFMDFGPKAPEKVSTKHFLLPLLFICESAGNGSSLEVNPLT